MRFKTTDLITTILPSDYFISSPGQGQFQYRLADIMGKCTHTRHMPGCIHPLSSFPQPDKKPEKSAGEFDKFSIESHRAELKKKLLSEATAEPAR